MPNPFVQIVKSLLRKPRVQKLRIFSSHRLEDPTPTKNRLNHSIRIAYIAYKLSKLFGQDPSYCARAGMLHDIGYAAVTPEFTQTHVFDHALAGVHLLKPTKEPEMVLEAVRTHMFPIGPVPKTVFSFVIWFADKLDWILYLTHLTRFFDNHINRKLKTT